MNIEFTQKQIECLSIQNGKSYVVEKWPRFELFDEIMSKNENLLALVNNTEKELKNYIIDYFPDDDCELIYYEDNLTLIIAYNFFTKSNFECLPMYDTTCYENGDEIGACLLIKREYR